MKAWMKLTYVSLALGIAVPAWPSTAYQGALQDMHFMTNGTVLVTSTGNRPGVPSCATAPGRFAFDSTTPGGRTMLAGLLAAEAADRDVVIAGTGNCDVYSDSETIGYIYIVG